jgi:hypothetical protein
LNQLIEGDAARTRRLCLVLAIANALSRDLPPDIESVEVLDPKGEYGNDGVLSVLFSGDEEATFVSITIDS